MSPPRDDQEPPGGTPPPSRLWFRLDPASGVPLHVQLREQVRSAVASGVLRPGDRLPSVRELALHLTVNPNTVFKVYQELDHDGLLETMHGKGVFVRAVEAPRLSDPERRGRIEAAIDHLVAQAVGFGYTAEDLVRMVDERVRRRWRGAGTAERVRDAPGDPGHGQQVSKSDEGAGRA